MCAWSPVNVFKGCSFQAQISKISFKRIYKILILNTRVKVCTSLHVKVQVKIRFYKKNHETFFRGKPRGRGEHGAQGSLNNWAPLSIDGWSFCKNWNLRFKLDFHGWSFRRNRNLRFKPDFHHSSHVLAVQFQFQWCDGLSGGHWENVCLLSPQKRQKQQ